MSWQQIELLSVAPSAWRNGGGLTRELLTWPNALDWRWRLSVAEVAQSGPFSRFEGVRRWFAVLHGAGVRLNVGGQSHVLTPASAPLCFDGALPADCALLDGATQDFNLMLRAGTAGARMRRLAGEMSCVLNAAQTIAVYAIDGKVELRVDAEPLGMRIAAQTLAWRSLPAGTTVRVGGARALWMEMDE